ncbi:cytospin-A [Anguilla anguilla]|uniref:cytospin-A n=1 Tax=Anguilla anguilla TaxID=7936 RepID=UPI0015AF2E35|nr:cytospin-A [Anguilla anguilla]XP_035241427.1 cytospin-A [Anguilla anguilla]XP_035241511.1 cytospin-A [Anguilla anguilla]XP_035241582.1 cytospin-A [Anguilla anguilla]
MGNFASKEGQVPTGGAHLDLYHSLPASPLAAKLQSAPLPLAPAPKKPDGLKLGSTRGSHKERRPPTRSSSLTVTMKQGTQTGSDVDAVLSAPPSLASSPLSESGRLDKDGGQKTPWAPGDGKGDGQEDRRGDISALRRLLLECRTSLDSSPEDDDDEDGTQGAADLLRCVLLERGELVKEVQSLKETLETERAEWLQFQSDLQVAVSVADRLHLEAQEELEKLRGDQEEKERQLATARERQLEAERELETARAELEETRRKVAALTVELSEPRGGTQARTGQVAGGGSAMVTDRSERKQGSGGGTESGLREGPVAEQPQVDGKGVSEASLQSTAPEEKNRGEGRNSPSAMRAVEQSRSLSRLPLPSSSTSTMNGISQATTTTSQGSLSKNWNPTRGKRADPALEGQETGSTEKQEEVEPANKHDATSTDVPHKVSKAQDGFSLLLRRHGGSKRNSLLRWCQSRTQGYKNIDITNFSSSWSDGLAFCAVYHTYLPSLIPYSSLCPADRRENLSLAFRTGESVGITASLTVDEVLRRGGPDWQKVLGYVESIYRHFEM